MLSALCVAGGQPLNSGVGRAYLKGFMNVMRMLRNTYLTLIIASLLLSVSPASLSSVQVVYAEEKPSVVSPDLPKYPPIAAAADVKGSVVVEVDVDSAGSVVSAKAVEGHPLLRRAAEESAKLWEFNPASDGTVSRSASLTFAFVGIQFIESTESRDESVYVPPYRMEVTRKIATIAPLTKVNGKIPEESCPLHSELMKLDVVPILYGLPVATMKYSNDDVVNLFRNAWGKLTHQETYDEARYKKFPYSNKTVGGGCIAGHERKAETLYCPKCRAIEIKWRKKHPNEGPRIVAVISGG
ncbi:MAG TPA: TonB family protein [Pyrinomonadaceae bacterium]|nr:TonB family protein [Pyrinomonadaceae bacterium]